MILILLVPSAIVSVAMTFKSNAHGFGSVISVNSHSDKEQSLWGSNVFTISPQSPSYLSNFIGFGDRTRTFKSDSVGV